MLRNRAHSHTTDTAFMTTEGTKSQIFNALSIFNLPKHADTSIRLSFPKSKREHYCLTRDRVWMNQACRLYITGRTWNRLYSERWCFYNLEGVLISITQNYFWDLLF